MPILTPRGNRDVVPERGITALANAAPRGLRSRVLHLCRYPQSCCAVCDRHRERCGHPPGGQSR